jgi:hypothetical protein
MIIKSLRIFLFSIFLFPVTLFAQATYSVKGVANDNVDLVKLYNTSVMVLNAKDSTLVNFTRAADDGSFVINGLSKGKFILVLAYPDYADYVEHFSLDSLNHEHDFGTINMGLKERLLKEVLVKGAKAIKIKGDTTEFNAAAYVTQPNAKVEDLLKQLPGIQVDKDGKITAQGQTVSKVLVDGEEFFGDDPTLVTKNIRADMVDKVQLYDKKSDQAAFTGIDDGTKTKTINIQLKSDKKSGEFGKAEAGGGTDGYYQGQLLFNVFKDKQKFSAYGITGNNSKVGLGWEDSQKYGSGQDVQFGDGGEIFINGSNSDDLDSFDGRFNGQGIPTARTGGLHYDSKWNGDKESINTNYKVGSINIDGVADNLTQNNLPGTVLNSTSDQTFHNYLFRQKLDAVYQVKLDTTQNLKISVDGTQKHSTTNNSYTTSESRNDTLINNSTRKILNTVDQKALNASIFYTKKFKKVGRTFSATISEAYSSSQAKGFLNSDIKFYNAQRVQDSAQIIDEYKTNNLKSNIIKTNFTYSEPFSKSFALLLNYGFGTNNSSADRQSFNPSSPGIYNVLVDSLSSNYRLNETSNQAGAIFNYKKGKTTFNFGSRVTNVSYHQVDEFTGDVLNRHFINWAPQASYQYRFSQQKSLRISYNGTTVQPTLDQIQPLRVNNDPLNIILGNPDLKPSFTNGFNINYNSYRVLTQQYLYFYGGYNFTTNPIANDITTNPVSGQSISQYLNLPGKQTTSFYFGGDFGKKIEKLGVNLGAGINANGNTYYSLVNDEINLTKSYTYNPRISINQYKEKKFDYYLSAGPTFTISESSLQPTINNNGAGFKADGQFNIYLPGKIQVGSNDTYEYTAPTESFNTDFKRLLINAYIIKSLNKSESFKIELWGNDLLNQNVGFSRTASSNFINQSSYTTIKRYFMLTLTYDFSKVGLGAAPKK